MLKVPSHLYDTMVRQANEEAPMECCGLLVGDSDVKELVPLRNHLASPTRYEANPHDLFAAFRDLREKRWEILAIYHSHPTSPALPSKVDLSENFYGPVPRIIISLLHDPPDVRAFVLRESEYDEIICERQSSSGGTSCGSC